MSKEYRNEFGQPIGRPLPGWSPRPRPARSGKCDSLKAASQAAAERLGFRYEGLFRQATIYKGRSHDTA